MHIDSTTPLEDSLVFDAAELELRESPVGAAITVAGSCKVDVALRYVGNPPTDTVTSGATAALAVGAGLLVSRKIDDSVV
jgi:hypothetical protein